MSMGSMPRGPVTPLCIAYWVTTLASFVRRPILENRSNWLSAHLQATAMPISSRNWAFPNQVMNRTVYLWIQDADDSLNVALVRKGRYPAGMMQDMLEADRQQADLFKDPQVRRLPRIPGAGARQNTGRAKTPSVSDGLCLRTKDARGLPSRSRSATPRKGVLVRRRNKGTKPTAR